MKKNIKMKMIFLLAISFIIVDLSSTAQVADYDGNSYRTIKIGDQTWMSDNLNVSHFRNGEAIPEARSRDEWEYAWNKHLPVWAYYDWNPENGIKYGKLYNWYAVTDKRGIAPKGWHVPDANELNLMVNSVGNSPTPKLKSTSGWKQDESGGRDIPCYNCKSWSEEYRSKVPCHVCKDTRYYGKTPVTRTNGNGTNSSGFSAIPGGKLPFFALFSNFSDLGTEGYWWSTTNESDNEVMVLWLTNSNDQYNPFQSVVSLTGCSVRCIKDKFIENSEKISSNDIPINDYYVAPPVQTSYIKKSVSFTNKTPDDVYVVLTWYENNNWKSNGWYKIVTDQEFDINLEYGWDRIYWYAEDKNGESGAHSDGTSAQFCIDRQKAFKITDHRCPGKVGFNQIILDSAGIKKILLLEGHTKITCIDKPIQTQSTQKTVYFTNKTPGDIYIVTAWYENNGWISKGWYNVKPDQKLILFKKQYQWDRIYWYAEDDKGGAGACWTGDVARLCIDRPNPFEISNQNCQSKVGFNQIILKSDEFEQQLILGK